MGTTTKSVKYKMGAAATPSLRTTRTLGSRGNSLFSSCLFVFFAFAAPLHAARAMRNNSAELFHSRNRMRFPLMLKQSKILSNYGIIKVQGSKINTNQPSGVFYC